MFLKNLKENKVIVFNYEIISSFERDLFLTIQGVLNDRYNYRLEGLTYFHIANFKEKINRENIVLDKDIKSLLDTSFEINSIINKRNTSIGYGGAKSTSLDNKNYTLLIELIEYYISLYEKIGV